MENKISRFSILNKYALITGAGGILGPQHSKALLEIGASVILTDINNNKLVEAKEYLLKEGFDASKIHCYKMDVGDEVSIKAVATQLKKTGIKVDILVNNAAINPTKSSLENNIRTTRLENFSIDRWNQEILVVLTGSYLCGKVFGSEMASNGGGGVILNIASV